MPEVTEKDVASLTDDVGVDKKPRTAQKPVVGIGGVSRELGDPRAIRLGGHARDVDARRGQFNQHIRRDGLVRIAHRCALEAFPHPRREAFHLFQPNHALSTDPVALVPVSAGTAVGAATRFMRGPNQHAELPIPLGVRRLGTPGPGVECTRRDLERPTRHCQLNESGPE